MLKNDDCLKSIALLHDIVEDTHITLGNLREKGFPEEIIDAVDAITKREGEKCDEYLQRVVKTASLLAVNIMYSRTFRDFGTILILRYKKSL